MPYPINRRQFVRSSTTGLLAVNLAGTTSANENQSNTIHESARDIPIAGEFDVLICGAGPAGIAAAIAAARTGAKTQLLEMHGCLGGVWTAGLLSWILDTIDRPGLLPEIYSELKKRGAGKKYGSNKAIAYDVEEMKLLLEELCLNAGVKIQLHTHVVAAQRNPQNQLSTIVTESKSGRQAWKAKVFIDTTGDGDVAAQAGCSFDYGREEDGATQPMSLIALLTGIKKGEVDRFVRGLAEPIGFKDPKTELLNELGKANVTPSYSRPTLFCIHDDLFCMMANHEYGVCAYDAAEITDATLRARAEYFRIVNGLRSLGGVWSDIRIVATGEQIGVREGRRIHGLYTVSTEDLVNGMRHDDAVCRVTFPVDVHAPKHEKGTGGIDRTGIRSKPYEIPLRALIAKDVDGLMMAGRCISGDFIAHSSYRVTGNAVSMGEAAGVTAALAAEKNLKPQEVEWREIIAAIHKL